GWPLAGAWARGGGRGAGARGRAARRRGGRAFAAPAPPADDGTKDGKAALADAAAARRAAQKLDGTARTEALSSLAERYVGLAGKEDFAAGGRGEAAFRPGAALRSPGGGPPAAACLAPTAR